VVLLEELQRIKARPPLGGMGVSMIGPTLLEYGTEEQKLRHLPPIARGELAWCQGYSEPGAGSDLASLQTRAEDKGDYYLINGSKIWTSGANYADWIFCLVRTNRDVPKHNGISFLLFSMDSPGVSTKPIVLINGHSPFCQTFFDDVKVPKNDLVHEVDKGWTVAKRLLQHERSGLAALASADTAGPLERIKPSLRLADLAAAYSDTSALDDPVLRQDIVANEMLKQAFVLTQQRAVEESAANTPGAATSIFKYVEANYVQAQLELQLRIRGLQGVGWGGAQFTEEETRMTRLWLEAKAISIAGGSNEIQLNIIAKRVLGLPD
jgi:alkylation response protein AidB-like acyl-CoA dehydrogenase